MKAVPKLRFKGFVDQWRIKRGSELFINSRTKGNDYLPLYSVTLDKGMIPRDSLDRRMESEMEAGDNLFVAKNDISYNMMRMWQGAYGLAPSDCMVSPAYVVLHPRENVSSDFFTKYFSRSRSLYLFTAFSYGLTSDRLRLYFKDFAQIKFSCPSLPEQQKIASFLSIVDVKIQQLTRKKELLEQYKKGVMQQLFSGKLRFKDENGKAYPKWEKQKLGEISDIYQPKTISQSELSDSGYDVYGANGIIGKHSEYNHELPQVAVTCRGSTCGLVNFTKPKSWITGNAMVINVDKSKLIEKKFLFYQMSNANLKYLITGSGQPQITGAIKVHRIVLPFKQEQQRIASFLSALDAKIESIATHIGHTQTFKKGLLQQMFV